MLKSAVLLATSLTRVLVFDHGSEFVAKRYPEERLGEDSHFADPNVLAVADGVGGTKKHGINSGDYARNLTAIIGEFYYERVAELCRKPKLMIVEAERRNPNPGKSTVVVATLQGDLLQAAYVGDSGYALFAREANATRLTFRSPPQQSSFNHPMQLRLGRHNSQWAVEHAHPIMPGSLVVLGSDGLFDNVFDAELEAIVGKLYGLPAARIAHELCKFAFLRSRDPTTLSPFSQSAQLHKPAASGGKKDDITVVVSYIVEHEEED